MLLHDVVGNWTPLVVVVSYRRTDFLEMFTAGAEVGIRCVYEYPEFILWKTMASAAAVELLKEGLGSYRNLCAK